jgi:hypothetical protein
LEQFIPQHKAFAGGKPETSSGWVFLLISHKIPDGWCFAPAYPADDHALLFLCSEECVKKYDHDPSEWGEWPTYSV